VCFVKLIVIAVSYLEVSLEALKLLFEALEKFWMA
jgi:hypothetical protein